jgi:UDP-N-acetylglucosamine:LPS N-acetylglucosamine transferase
MMSEATLNADTLTDAVRSILTDAKVANKMKQAAQKQSVKDCAEKIAALIEKEATKAA